jgi:hypothetical protein
VNILIYFLCPSIEVEAGSLGIVHRLEVVVKPHEPEADTQHPDGNSSHLCRCWHFIRLSVSRGIFGDRCGILARSFSRVNLHGFPTQARLSRSLLTYRVFRRNRMPVKAVDSVLRPNELVDSRSARQRQRNFG